MLELRASHSVHGFVPTHDLRRVADLLEVSTRSLQTQYDEWHRRLEMSAGEVDLGGGLARRVCDAADFATAYRGALGEDPDIDFVLFERAIWRAEGDPELRALRQRERTVRRRDWALTECPACHWTSIEKEND